MIRATEKPVRRLEIANARVLKRRQLTILPSALRCFFLGT